MFKKHLDLENFKSFGANSMSDHLGIEFVEIGEDYVTARMPVDHRTTQPFGILHGGASVVLAESLGSLAANFCVDTERFYFQYLAFQFCLAFFYHGRLHQACFFFCKSGFYKLVHAFSIFTAG